MYFIYAKLVSYRSKKFFKLFVLLCNKKKNTKIKFFFFLNSKFVQNLILHLLKKNLAMQPYYLTFYDQKTKKQKISWKDFSQKSIKNNFWIFSSFRVLLTPFHREKNVFERKNSKFWSFDLDNCFFLSRINKFIYFMHIFQWNIVYLCKKMHNILVYNII